jgi:hypothetical protein
MSVLTANFPAPSPAPSLERDVRDPSLLLAQLFDRNDCDPLHPADENEVRTAPGESTSAGGRSCSTPSLTPWSRG